MVTDLLLVKLVHTHLNNDIEIINGLESVHPQKCMDKSRVKTGRVWQQVADIRH